jgi:hypothetical protein
MIDFCFDRIKNHKMREVYPNLAPSLSGDFYENKGSFSKLSPFSDPPRLIEYMSTEKIEYGLYLTTECPIGGFYFININYFDHAVDWFELMPQATLLRLQNNEIKVLFSYCEADSPYEIKKTLHYYSLLHNINIDQIHFISHSTVAEQLKNFYYFNDDELLFKSAQNYSKSQSQWSNNKEKKFTFLIRSHKNWRLIVGSEFFHNKLHEVSYVSYNGMETADGFNYADDTDMSVDNPLWDAKLDTNSIHKFKRITPFSADVLSDNEHNNYETHIDEFYSNAFWNIVCETHIDINGSNGTFITEKTWKPIRHNQPFIIIGTVHSLKHLKDMGYKTFGNVIDESYDDVVDSKLRYYKIKEVIKYISSKSLQELSAINAEIKPIVEHNSMLFNSPNTKRLNELIAKINT